jgi:flagellar biosynthesis protein FlhF
MEVKTYRARTMQEALLLVRRDLGPSAAVLHTREICGSRLLSWIPGMRKIEVLASSQVNVPSRLPPREPDPPAPSPRASAAPVTLPRDIRDPFREQVQGQLSELQSMVEALCRRTRQSSQPDLPESLFRLYTDLIDAEVGEDLARELVESMRHSALPGDDPMLLKAHIARTIEDQIRVSGPLALAPGRSHVVALVGPTGVGKTTTIAKLAANYRLREKRKVGLITVDTYRIAAVEQLRTYADIIDLPMQVVSTPREMREAVQSMSNLDLVLLDTAGRSPKDEVKIQELRAFLTEAGAHEVHLVLSSVAGGSSLQRTAERFAEVGTTALILTKLDEAMGLGSLFPLLRGSRLPLSYVTDGQNVPDDIAPADACRLARLVLGMEGQ